MNLAPVASQRARIAVYGCAAVFSVVVLSAAITSVGEPQQLRLLSYNIHHGEGLDGKVDLSRIAKVVMSASPDIVLLQEVDRNVTRSGNVDQASELARFTGMHVVFGANLKIGEGDYGNAILSRFPLSKAKNLRLPGREKGEPRGVLGADVTLPDFFGNATFRILVTHLDHMSQDTDRLRAVDVITQWAEEDGRLVVIGGDFNATAQSAVMKRLRKKWTLVGSGEYLTFPATIPQRQIDFIGYRSAARVAVGEVIVLEEAIASDHRPLFACIQIYH